MGRKKYLHLKPSEVAHVLKAFGFVHKRTTGDHEQWEGCVREERRVVTVQLKSGEYDNRRMKTIIKNTGLTVEEFYGKDERIAQRYFGKK